MTFDALDPTRRRCQPPQEHRSFPSGTLVPAFQCQGKRTATLEVRHRVPIKCGGSCNYGESMDFEDRKKHVEVFAQGAFLDRSAGTPGYSAALVCDSVGREGRSDPSASAAGSVTRNRAPRPSPSLCASIVPPCNSTRWRTIASPSPRPRLGSEPDGVPCRNGSNTCGRNPGSMPMPVSAMTISTPSSTP